jgi:hypothetical protein
MGRIKYFRNSATQRVLIESAIKVLKEHDCIFVAGIIDGTRNIQIYACKYPHEAGVYVASHIYFEESAQGISTSVTTKYTQPVLALLDTISDKNATVELILEDSVQLTGAVHMNKLTVATGTVDSLGCMRPNDDDRTLPIKEAIKEFETELSTMTKDKTVELGYYDKEDNYIGLVMVIGAEADAIEPNMYQSEDTLDEVIVEVYETDGICEVVIDHYHSGGKYLYEGKTDGTRYDSYAFKVVIH